MFAHGFRRHRGVIERAVGDPFIFAIGFDHDAHRVKTRRVRLHMHRHFQDGAGCRRMDGSRNPAIRLADQLTFQYVVARLDDRARRAANTLMQRHDQT